MTFLVVGASAGLGRALAEELARSHQSLVLASSDLRDTTATATDLQLRHGIRAIPVRLDLAEESTSFAAMDAALAELSPLLGIAIAAGATSSGDMPGASSGEFDALVRTNFGAPCQIIDRYLHRLRDANRGIIVGFGSVAATRGRSRNAAYAASKRALDSYYESLRHSLSNTSVLVQFYIVGYLDTNLSFGQTTRLPRADPRMLAKKVVRRSGLDFGRSYFPAFWRPVCGIVRWLPYSVFRRLTF